MSDRLVKEDAPVDFPFRPGKDVLPGKGEWFKRNNVFFRDKVGEFSDIYDTCTKVSEKREIARLVVEAVYSNGGRFLDAEGNDIGFKRSMDKAMKALKDRRHIKSRKITQRTNIQSAEAIKKHVEATKQRTKAASPKPHKVPLTADDAGYALLLLRQADEDKDNRRESPSPDTIRVSERDSGNRCEKQPVSLPSALKKSRDSDDVDFRHPVDEYEQSRRHVSRYSNVCFSERERPRQPRPSSTAQDPPTFNKAPVILDKEKKSVPADKAKEGTEEMPVLWQSVIVSRESPQASLADMLVNAKQRLDALSSIQQAVSAPICLIYPPNPNFSLAGQLPLQGQVPLGRVQLNQEIFQGAARAGVR